jgi:multicomponent Na+:H+ antiporter subunit D
MGLAAALCLAIGLLPGRFYVLLPYRDEALLYLAQDLFSGEHILTQMQLLAFAVLAFVVLRRLRLYPPERRGVILDVEWLWRKAGRLAGQAIVRQAGRATVAVERTTGLAVARVLGGASQVFAPDRWTARNLSLAGSAIWTLGLLGFVAILAIFARYR